MDRDDGEVIVLGTLFIDTEFHDSTKFHEGSGARIACFVLQREGSECALFVQQTRDGHALPKNKIERFSPELAIEKANLIAKQSETAFKLTALESVMTTFTDREWIGFCSLHKFHSDFAEKCLVELDEFIEKEKAKSKTSFRDRMTEELERAEEITEEIAEETKQSKHWGTF